MSEVLKTGPTQPANTDYAHSSQYRIKMARFPNTEYFAQSFILPEVYNGLTPTATPKLEIHFPDTTLVYSPLQIEMIIDENYTCYEEMLDWMKGLSGVDKPLISTKDWQTDISIYMLTNAGNPNKRIVFQDAFPVSIGSVSFSQTTPSETMICSVVFSYNIFGFAN